MQSAEANDEAQKQQLGQALVQAMLFAPTRDGSRKRQKQRGAAQHPFVPIPSCWCPLRLLPTKRPSHQRTEFA